MSNPRLRQDLWLPAVSCFQHLHAGLLNRTANVTFGARNVSIDHGFAALVLTARIGFEGRRKVGGEKRVNAK